MLWQSAAVIRWKTALSCYLSKKRRYIHEPISVLTQYSYCCVGQGLELTDTATNKIVKYIMTVAICVTNIARDRVIYAALNHNRLFRRKALLLSLLRSGW
jgi:hypothetical protein